MKTQLHKLIGTAVFSLALVSHSLPAWAGLIYNPEVSIASFGAVGSMAGARYSADNQQYIGCSLANNIGTYITCSATDKTGKSLSCSAPPQWLATVKAITDSSLISFSVTPYTFSCSSLAV